MFRCNLEDSSEKQTRFEVNPPPAAQTCALFKMITWNVTGTDRSVYAEEHDMTNMSICSGCDVKTVI